MNFAYSEELDGASPMLGNQGRRPFLHQEHDHEQEHQLLIQEEYIDEETEALKEKGKDDLPDQYKNNQNFREEIVSFV